MKSFGQELKRERELRGISLKEIADSTKINLRFLRALEDDRLDILPGKFFTKGILRTYAKYIDLEEETILNLYYESIQDQKQELEDKPVKKDLPPEISKKKKIIIFSIAAVFILIIISLYFILQKKEGNSFEITSLPKPNITFKSKEMPPPVIALKEKKEEKKELRLKLIFHEETWIQVYADEIIKLDELMLPGQQSEIVASNNLLINLRNAGGLTYFINNIQGKPFGKSGQTINYIRINLDNFKEFLK